MGLAYQANAKTVIRASSGINYAISGNSVVPSTFGFGNTPSFSSPDGYTPLYYLDSGTFPQDFARPPVLDPSFRNGQSINYIPRTGTRLPQIVNWSLGIQREVARNTVVEANYIGSRSTHLGFATNYNYMPIEGLQYGSLLLQPITSAAAAAAGFSSPYPSFASQRGANTVYQSLRPYPQYTAVTTGGGVFFGGPAPGGVADPVGQAKFNSLQVKVNRRFSEGLTLFGFVTWSKSFTMVLDQYPGNRIFQLDAQPALTYSVSWAYELPFGKRQAVAEFRLSSFECSRLWLESERIPEVQLWCASQHRRGRGQFECGGLYAARQCSPCVSPYKTTNPRDFDPASGSIPES